MVRAIMIAVTVMVLIGVAVAIANIVAPTGNTLLVICKEYEKELAGRDYNSFKAGMCKGSISGMWNMSTRVCSPPEATAKQAVLVVIKHLSKSQAQLHRSSIYLVEEALRQAWPCY